MPLLIDVDPDDEAASQLKRGEDVTPLQTVKLGGEAYELPARFALAYQPASAGEVSDEPAWRMEFTVRDGIPQCRRITIEATHDGREIRSIDLRLKVEDLLELAARNVAVRRVVVDGEVRLLRSLDDFHSGDTLRAVRRTRQAGRRRITDDVLRAVATVYRQNVESNPTAAVSAHLGVADRTARLYVKRARDAGFLGEAVPGKPGER